MAGKRVFSVLALLGAILFFAAIASAQQWTYGGTFDYINDAQTASAFGHLNATSISTSSSATYSSTNPTGFFPQSVTGEFTNSLGAPISLIIVQNGNYLQFYDRTGMLVNEYLTGSGIGQIDLTDFDSDGSVDDIVGIWSYNSTQWAYRSYAYNSTSNTLSLAIENNRSAGTSSTGMRCLGANIYEGGHLCYSYIYNGTRINMTKFYPNNSVGDYFINTSTSAPFEMPAFVDADGDGTLDFLAVTNQKVIIFNQNGVIRTEFNTSGCNGKVTCVISSGRFADVDSTQYYKVYYTEDSFTTGAGGAVQLFAKKLDGSTQFATKTIQTTTLSVQPYGDGMALADFDNDGFDDIFVAAHNFTTGNVSVYKGNTGALLYANTLTGFAGTGGQSSPQGSVILGKIYNSVYSALIYSSYSVSNTKILNLGDNTTLSAISGVCSPTDVNIDGFLELVCSAGTILSSTYTNQNAAITSTAFDPSTTVPVSTNLNAFIYANDPESDIIYYKVNCGINATNSTEDTSNTKTCVYSSVGTYSFMAYARDVYHSGIYSSQQVNITVTQSGGLCNNNGVCEPSIGESTGNCPTDCPVNTTQTTGGANGSMVLPLDIVNVDNPDEGLLPMIFAAIMVFFSWVLRPAMLLFFSVMIILCLVAIFSLVKHIAHKI